MSDPIAMPTEYSTEESEPQFWPAQRGLPDRVDPQDMTTTIAAEVDESDSHLLGKFFPVGMTGMKRCQHCIFSMRIEAVS